MKIQVPLRCPSDNSPRQSYSSIDKIRRSKLSLAWPVSNWQTQIYGVFEHNCMSYVCVQHSGLPSKLTLFLFWTLNCVSIPGYIVLIDQSAPGCTQKSSTDYLHCIVQSQVALWRMDILKELIWCGQRLNVIRVKLGDFLCYLVNRFCCYETFRSMHSDRNKSIENRRNNVTFLQTPQTLKLSWPSSNELFTGWRPLYQV